MRKTTLTALVSGMLSDHTMATAPKAFMVAFEQATELEWDVACHLVDEGKREIERGARNLRRWWIPVVVSRELAAAA